MPNGRLKTKENRSVHFKNINFIIQRTTTLKIEDEDAKVEGSFFENKQYFEVK